MIPRKYPHLLFLFFFSAFCPGANAQNNGFALPPKCGTLPRLEKLFRQNPQQRFLFEQSQNRLNRLSSAQDKALRRSLRAAADITIPVVFHVVMPDPDLVSDEQILAQLDTLNISFAGANADSVRIPAYFKPFFGKSSIRFCLARRTPDGEETTGIQRKRTSRASFEADDAMKHISTGGTESWNTSAYLNIWICSLSGGILGYATFPEDGFPLDQGVVVDYRSLPGGSFPNYGKGKTLVHETGHYFNLHHIWGDDNGLCSGTDNVDDTPNQGNSTSGCTTGVRTDNCTPGGNGIMYQNYMDYSYDACLVMFTPGQVSRMEEALALTRASLLTSAACQPVSRKKFDVQVRAINEPQKRLCEPGFVPQVTIRNGGSQTLTSVTLYAQIDNGPVSVTEWTGSLASTETATVFLEKLATGSGNHVLTVYSSNPNGTGDEEKMNDTLQLAFQYFPPVTSISESFEQDLFPPTAWDIINPDSGITWERMTGAAKTGNASAVIRNFDYAAIGQTDDLRLPQVSIPATVDSAFFSFQVAAATYTSTGTAGNEWDTLEVLISTDCGRTYTSLYKKWGASLVTSVSAFPDAFVPGPDDWRKDSVNLMAYIGQSNLLLAFRNTTGYENNLYLDDIHLRTVTVNPNLKKSGFLVTPNPARSLITVQFYPQPAGLKAIQLFHVNGQKLQERIITSGQASNAYSFDLSRYPPGMYIVRAVFSDKVLTQKLIRY